MRLFQYRSPSVKGTISEREKRTLEKKPEFALTNFSQYDAYFQDRFGGRDAFVDIANFIDYKVFNSNGRVGLGSSNNGAVKGKNGWFFAISAGNINDYLKTNLLTESEKLVQLLFNSFNLFLPKLVIL